MVFPSIRIACVPVSTAGTQAYEMSLSLRYAVATVDWTRRQSEVDAIRATEVLVLVAPWGLLQWRTCTSLANKTIKKSVVDA